MQSENFMKESKKVLIKAPYIDQSIKYPTGCESVSAVMLLHFLGIDITVDEFIEKYLRKQEFTEQGGELFGPDPRKYFCGSPYDEDAFGCYAPVITDSFIRIFRESKDRSYEVMDETGTETEELLIKYIDRGMPVLYWACIDMREPVIGPRWRIRETGEMFTWISNEHCMLLVGYDEDNYYFNDPYNGNGLIGYERKLTEKRHRAQYMQAVGVKGL